MMIYTLSFSSPYESYIVGAYTSRDKAEKILQYFLSSHNEGTYEANPFYYDITELLLE